MTHRSNHRVTLVKLSAFAAVSAAIAAYLVILVDDSPPDSMTSYTAVFKDVSGLQVGDEVRVASVAVGKVDAMGIGTRNTVRVAFDVPADIPLTRTTRATVRYKNLIGDRYLELAKPDGQSELLGENRTIPVSHTAAALDLDTLLNGFKPLFAGLAPKQINALSAQLIKVLQGQNGAVASLVTTIASFTTTVAERGELVGRVIDNLNAVLGTVDQHRDELSQVITELKNLSKGLDKDAPTVLAALGEIDNVAVSGEDLLARNDQTIAADLAGLRTVTGNLDRKDDQLASILDQLPGHYQSVMPTGSFGNFFNFYLCGLRLRITPESDPTAKPVTTPWINSDTARCQP